MLKGQKRASKPKPNPHPPIETSISGVMAGNCTQTTALATTPSIHNWWPHLHACSLSSWKPHHDDQLNINSDQSSGDESFPVSSSFTTASNHSGLSSTVESSSDQLIGETAVPDHNHIWNRAILIEGSNGGLHSSQSEPLSLGGWHPKNIPGCDIYDSSTASDSTRKQDHSSILPSMGSFSNVERQFNAQRVPIFAGNWYNMPPHEDGDIGHHHHHHQIDQLRTDAVNLSSVMMKDPYSLSGVGRQSTVHVDRILHEPTLSFGHGHHLFHHMLLDNRDLGDKTTHEFPNIIPWTNSRSFTQLVPSSVGHVSRLSVDSNPVFQTLDLSGSGKQAFRSTTMPMSQKAISSNAALPLEKRNNTPFLSTSGGKKRKPPPDDNLHSVFKKQKPDVAMNTPSTKMQFPKAKLADKITALQQIVSPFGKTDTASVLGEAIACVRFLQEQIQLFCCPYMKGNASKEVWVGLNGKGGVDGKLDLKSRGLCLVPISCAPQLYRESSCTGSDYLTPLYRGCLHR